MRALAPGTRFSPLSARIQAFSAASSAVPRQTPHTNAALAAEVTPSAYDFSAASAAIEKAIAEKKLPGAILLVGHGGKVVFEQAYGVRKYAGEPGLDGKPSPAEPMTVDTIFDMASLTKCLATATAVMQLVEQGKVDVDAPVVKYLPEFGVNGKEKVTVRELLTHYSGLPEDVNLKDAWGLAKPDKAEGIRRAMQSELKSVPGTKFVYSDVNFITLGAIVEKVSGESLDEYAERQIFGPLGMTHTRYLAMGEDCGYGIAFMPFSKDRKGQVYGEAVMQPCGPNSWKRQEWVPNVAPTQHDNEGTAETNQNFDHLLRGTVHDPTTRRMGGVAGHAGVFSTADDVAKFAQALLDRLAGRPSDFPLKRETLELMTRPEQPSTAMGGATIFTQDGKATTGVAARAFGWDINSAFSRPRGEVFPIGSFGHTGFTGTSLWMDPGSDTYVVLLANSVHPRGAVPISPLRGEVATDVGKALGIGGAPTQVSEARPGAPASVALQPTHRDEAAMNGAPGLVAGSNVKTGIDVLEATNFAVLKEMAAKHGGKLRVGLLTNQTGLDAQGRRTIDVLRGVGSGIELVALFSPEHGIFGAKDSTEIGQEVDAASGLKVTSLYGPKDADRRPKAEDLKGLDAVVIDLQDAGVRFYTYETVVGYFVEAAACEAAREHALEVVVLDRPALIGGEVVQGPVSDMAASYINYMPEPVRNGMTLGELAEYDAGEHPGACGVEPGAKAPLVQGGVSVGLKPHANPVTVVPMKGWTRGEFFDETGVKWVNPSPNLRSMEEAVLYPGVGMLDATSVSVGRGTAMPFEVFGAGVTAATKTVAEVPAWFDGKTVAEYLTARKIPGVTFAATRFAVAETAEKYPYHGQTIEGVRMAVTDRSALDSPEMGVEILAALHHLYPAQFKLDKAAALVANSKTMDALSRGDDPRAIAAGWAPALAEFDARRSKYLLYP